MDPVTAVGIALSVASLAGQVFSSSIQGIQFIITAMHLPEDSKYLNLRLRMEQQRLFAWSETSGLMDLQNADDQKIRDSNTFIIHRTTILDLLVQIQHLFQEFEKAQIKNGHLKFALEGAETDDQFTQDPEKEFSSAHVPLSKRRRDFIVTAMKSVKSRAAGGINTGWKRLKWVSFDKPAFEDLLQRFSTLNDNMTDILDARLQTEIHCATQDTNRGVLQLHKDLASLHRLVKALDIKMQARTPVLAAPQYTQTNDALGIHLLTQLARFKAFNESLDTPNPWDPATAEFMGISQKPELEKAATKIDSSNIRLDPQTMSSGIRCEATYTNADKKTQNVWIEWKDYDDQIPGSLPPPKLIERVQKLASLLHHTPKPEAFRVPHCLGYFDNGPLSSDEDDDEIDPRIGFVFEKPQDEGVAPDTPPVSLFDLFNSTPKPRVTDRVRVAHAVANCLLYLHSVNWLHKGLRSHNIVFFPITGEDSKKSINYTKPYLSGFDFARPARADEMTEIPGDVREFNIYRHPSTQGQGFGPRESFRKSFDIYSLGVVMVELAHWKIVENVLGKIRGAGKVKDMLLERESVEKVGSEMGELYEEATKKCLAGGEELGIQDFDDETSDEVAARLGKRFYEDVVKRLGDVRV